MSSIENIIKQHLKDTYHFDDDISLDVLVKSSRKALQASDRLREGAYRCNIHGTEMSTDGCIRSIEDIERIRSFLAGIVSNLSNANNFNTREYFHKIDTCLEAIEQILYD